MKKFSEAEIFEINKKYILSYEKINELPNCDLKIWNYSWHKYDAPRVFCVIDFKKWINKYNINNSSKCLGYTSNTDPELEYLKNIYDKVLINYPPYDLHNFYPEFENKFDFFIFSQTLEHLYNPLSALLNIYKYIKKDGYIFTSVPTINIPHMEPIHFSGIYPIGLAILFLSAGFEILEIGYWGNLDYINKLFNNFCWPGVEKLETIENNDKYPVQTWILATKK